MDTTTSIKALTPLINLKGHKASIISVEYARNCFLGEHILASGSEDNTCRIWDLKTFKVIKAIKGLTEPVTSVKFAKRKGSPFFYLSAGKYVHTYDLSTEDMILTEPVQTYEFSNDEINTIDVNDNNKFLATADDEGAVHIIDLSSHKIFKKTSKKHSNICMSVKFRPKKSWDVWSGGMDSHLFEWDFSRGSPTLMYDMRPKEPSASQMFNPPFVYDIDISSDGKWIAVGLGDTTVRLLLPPQKKNSSLLDVTLRDGHNAMVNCLSFVSTVQKDQAMKLVSGSPNSRISLWSFNDSLLTAADDLKPITYHLDKSIGKLNQLVAYQLTDNTINVVAAGTEALSVYTLQ